MFQHADLSLLRAVDRFGDETRDPAAQHRRELTLLLRRERRARRAALLAAFQAWATRPWSRPAPPASAEAEARPLALVRRAAGAREAPRAAQGTLSAPRRAA